MARPRTAAFLGTSLDGFIAGPHDELDWLERGGGPPEDNGFAGFFSSVDALLIGRRTWEVVSRFATWPYDDKRVFVLTRRPAEGNHGERFLEGPAARVLESLGADGVRRVYVDGGRVVSQVLAAGLLDELTVSILPVVIGRGIRLFEDAGPERWLHLASSKVFGSGMVQLRYAARRAPP
jgi:dihydrofolate reductase